MTKNQRIKKRRGARPGVQEEGMESESECCSGCFASIPVLTEVVRASTVPERPEMWENNSGGDLAIISACF
jgi:hypothetical protein